MLTGMGHSSARFKSNSSPIHMSLPEIDILCADHAMLKNRSRSCRGNENFEKNGEGHRGHMWEWCEMMPINTKFIKYINHNLREPCCFLAQNGLISPLGHIGYDCYELSAYLKVKQMNFDIQFWKPCCSLMHDWKNFNNVSFTPELGHNIPLF